MAHFRNLHDFSLSPTAAVALQKELRSQLQQIPLTRPIETIAGADISFNKYSPVVYAGIVVLKLPSLEVVEEVSVVSKADFPYVPGLLTFREAPAVLEAWEKLRTEPDAVMFDGQGTAHPRRMGIGAHLGLFVDRPSFGCAKSVLTGKFDDPAPQRGNWTPMMDKGEVIGAALRTKDRVQPVYVSPGHLIDLPGAIDLALRTNSGYRIPEPTRRAHLLVNAVRRAHQR